MSHDDQHDDQRHEQLHRRSEQRRPHQRSRRDDDQHALRGLDGGAAVGVVVATLIIGLNAHLLLGLVL